jgi:hypothetical protein
MPKRAGDPVELGDILGNPQEPYERWARVVGLRKDDCRSIEYVIIRLFSNPAERWPTGAYRTTWMTVPWEGGL